MNRLYAVEGVYSLTGAMADHRLRLESRQIAAFLAALAARLGAPGASSQAGADVSGVDRRWIDAVAKDLLANRGKGLIIAGERQPAACPRRGVRAERASRQHRQDGQLLRDEGRGASERELAGLARLRDDGGRGPDARRPRRQSCVRCPRRSRLRVGAWRRSLTRSRSGTRSTKHRPARSGISLARTTSNRGETRARLEARSASSSR